MDEVECPMCDGETVFGHDCGEDSCVCSGPQPNLTCPMCHGRGVVPEHVADAFLGGADGGGR